MFREINYTDFQAFVNELKWLMVKYFLKCFVIFSYYGKFIRDRITFLAFVSRSAFSSTSLII